MAHYNSHHLNALAKHLLTQTVSVMVGLTPTSQRFRCTMQDIERNPSRHLQCYNALLADGYVARDNDGTMLIADKVFDEVEAQPWVGTARCGSPREPLALWLSNGILKSIVLQVAAGEARVVVEDDGRRGVVFCHARRGGFPEYLARELPLLAQKHTDLGRVAAEGLRVAGDVTTGEDFAEVVTQTLDDRRADLARAKREVDALVALEFAIGRSGGWDMFVGRARRDFEAGEG